jgi:membrane associated rhomboid family serine protease
MPDGRFGWYAAKISAACFLVFVLTTAFPDFVFSNLALISSQVLLKPWMMVTHIFVHSGFVHLASNLFALLLFGSILEKLIGSKRFLAIFFAAGIASGIADIIFYPAAVGASGAVFGVMGCLAILRPRMIVWTYGVPMYMIVAMVLWAFLDFAGVFYPDDIAHAAHLFGMALGIASGLWMRDKYKGPGKKEIRYEVVSDRELDEWEERYMIS